MSSKPTRSSKYQNVFNEKFYPNEMLEAFSNDDGVFKRLNPYAYNDEIAELEEQLKKEFWRIINSHLTLRQRQVVELTAQGYTQMEVAKFLNVNQSSITKCIHGNTDYSKNKAVYGGIRNKLKKIIESDEKIKEILQKISDLRDENWL